MPTHWLHAAQQALAHRGPDGSNRVVGLDFAMVHTRLAIVDTEHGTQPITSEDGRFVTVVNGEFYDPHEVLRESLLARGHSFRSRSDSELLVHLYEEHGASCIDLLHGEFAFALYDTREKRLFAARDRFGVRPLFYTTHEGCFVVASDVHALFAIGAPRRWNESALIHSLHAHYVPHAQTLFQSIATLPAAHMLVHQPSQTRTTRYWKLEALPQRNYAADQHAADELGTSLSRAVKKRIPNEVAWAVQLSGGIDSTAVAALARAQSTQPVAAYTITFPDEPRWNEESTARDVARSLELEWRPVAMSQSQLMEVLPKAVESSTGLAINLHAAARFLLAERLRSDGCKVVLTGEGADEALLGYPHFQQDLFDHSRVSELLETHSLSRGSMLATGDGLALDGVAKALGHVPSFLRAKAEMGLRMRALLHPEAQRNDVSDTLLEGLELDTLHTLPPVLQSRALWTQMALARYILATVGDGVEMAHAIESRLPFLDTDVFTLAASMSPSLLIHRSAQGTHEKWPLRVWMSSRVPNAMRPKQPFLAPPVPLEHALVQDVLRSSQHLPDVIDPLRVRDWLDRLATIPVTQRILEEPVLLLLLSATLLHQRVSS